MITKSRCSFSLKFPQQCLPGLQDLQRLAQYLLSKAVIINNKNKKKKIRIKITMNNNCSTCLALTLLLNQFQGKYHDKNHLC